MSSPPSDEPLAELINGYKVKDLVDDVESESGSEEEEQSVSAKVVTQTTLVKADAQSGSGKGDTPLASTKDDDKSAKGDVIPTKGSVTGEDKFDFNLNRDLMSALLAANSWVSFDTKSATKDDLEWLSMDLDTLALYEKTKWSTVSPNAANEYPIAKIYLRNLHRVITRALQTASSGTELKSSAENLAEKESILRDFSELSKDNGQVPLDSKQSFIVSQQTHSGDIQTSIDARSQQQQSGDQTGSQPLGQARQSIASQQLSGGQFGQPVRRAREADVPTFDGLASNWHDFKAEFQLVVLDCPLVETITAKRWLKNAVPDEYKETVRVSPDCQTALARLSELIENDDEIHTEIIEQLKAVPMLPDRESLVELKKYRNNVLNIQHKVRPFGEVLLREAHATLARRLGKLYQPYMFKPKHKSLADLLLFLDQRVESLKDMSEHELHAGPLPSTSGNSNKPTNKPQPMATIATNNKSKMEPCAFCGKGHYRKGCPLSHQERCNALRSQGKCYGCFRVIAELPSGHRNTCTVRCRLCDRACTSSQVCLCREKASRGPSQSTGNSNNQGTGGSNSQNPPNNQGPRAGSTNANVHTPLNDETEGVTYLPTLRVKVENTVDKTEQSVRLLMDSGATDSFISEAIVAELNLKTEQIPPFYCNVFGGNSVITINKRATVNVKSVLRPNVSAEMNLLVMPGVLVGKLPAPSDKLREWAAKRHINLSDQESDNNEISVVIGQDMYNKHFLLDRTVVHRPLKTATFSPTNFGWVLQGASTGKSAHKPYANCVYMAISSPSKPSLIGEMNFTAHECICQDLQRLFLDPLTDPESTEKIKEWHREYYNQIEYDKESKRFVGGIPWNSELRPKTNIGAVLAQTAALKKRLERQSSFQKYSDVLQELVNDGHAEILDENVDWNEGYCVSHFPVVKESSETTPVRPVFNLAKANKGEASLNECMFKGVWQQPKLLDILLRFRTNPAVILADLKKAFLQIRIKEEDRKYLRFLWYYNGKMRMFQMKSLLFGAAASPYILYAAIRKLLETEAPALLPHLKNLYMDDLLLTGETVVNLEEALARLSEVLAMASFSMHKYVTLPEIAKSLNLESKEGLGNLLGIAWNLIDDTIQFKVPKLASKTLTRRVLASAFAVTFDPLGLLGPHQTRLKMLLRDVIEECKEWDTPLPPHLVTVGEEVLADFHNLAEVKFPRNVRLSKEYELWLFGDASNHAYGVCAYVHDISSKTTRLLCSRGNLAPNKHKKSIPKLELAAACLLAQTYKMIKSALEVPPMKVRHFTDSTVTLFRIKGNPNSQDQFVASRVREILKETSPNDWYHISTEHNPADVISRGTSLRLLRVHKLWTEGPALEVVKQSENKKLNGCANAVRVTPVRDSGVMERMISEMSYPSLQWFARRMFGFMDRVVGPDRLKERYGETIALLDTAAIADVRLWQEIQKVVLSEELEYLRAGKPVPASSPLHEAQLFIDGFGLVRARRRLDFSDIDFEIKFPLALVDHPATRNYIKFVHESKANHSGVNTTEHHVRLFTAIPNMNRITREVIKDCMTCRRYRTGQPFVPEVAPLPYDRSSKGFAFKAVGIDIFGPILTYKEKSTKFYGLIFVCARSRAIHLEVLDSREGSAIMDAFHRFAGIYGQPELVRSDNELSFHRASKTFKAVYNKYKKDILRWKDEMCPTIQWIFQPPAAPWWGAFWERLIGVVKKSISQIRLRECVTFSQLETRLRQVQCFVNSRPLLTKSGEYPLTPAHLVFGRPMEVIPPVKFPLRDTKDDALVDFTMLHKSLDAFWELYVVAYLPQLRDHSLKPTEAPKLNEIVIIADDNQPRNRWELGYITKLFPSHDGAIRKVEVQLFSGKRTRTRAIQKLVPVERSLLGEDVSAQWRVQRDLDTAGLAKPPRAISRGVLEPNTERGIEGAEDDAFDVAQSDDDYAGEFENQPERPIMELEGKRLRSGRVI